MPPLSPCRRPASLASRALRQLRQPRRITCPPLRNSSSRFRAIQSRPEPVKCGVRRISAFSGSPPAPVSKGVRRNLIADMLGVGPQADDPAGRPTRAPGRSELLVGRRQPTAPAAPLQQRQKRRACRRPCRKARRWSQVGLRGLERQAGWCQHRPPLPLPVQLRLACGGQQLKVLKSASPLAIQKLQWQLSRRESDGLAPVLPPRPAPCGPHLPPPRGRQSRRSLLRIQLQRVKDVGL